MHSSSAGGLRWSCKPFPKNAGSAYLFEANTVTHNRFSELVMKCTRLTLIALLPGIALAVHSYIKVPEISGVLLYEGKPQMNASVLLDTRRPYDNDFCKSAKIIGTTNASGFFHIDPVVEKKILPSLLNPPETVHQLITVCFSVSAARQLGVFMVAPTSRLLSIHLTCAWDGSKVGFNRFEIQPAREHGICADSEAADQP